MSTTEKPEQCKDAIAIFIVNIEHLTQLTFTCSKSTTKPLEKGVKYVQS